eukprot:5387829-Amphidinium_carterae.1
MQPSAVKTALHKGQLLPRRAVQANEDHELRPDTTNQRPNISVEELAVHGKNGQTRTQCQPLTQSGSAPIRRK